MKLFIGVKMTTHSDEIWIDPTTGLIWQVKDAGSMTWSQAMQYAENLELAGHSDWRLPEVEELESLMGRAKRNRTARRKIPLNIKSLFYWSSSTYSNHTDYAWLVDFSDGAAGSSKKLYTGCVRCVRGGQ
jgi:hypothetical protein